MSSTTPGPQQGQPEQSGQGAEAPQGGQPYAPPQGGQPYQGQPGPYATTSGSDPNRPGSLAWVEQRFGRVTEFGDRIVPYLVDALIPFAAMIVPVVLGMVALIAGLPDQEPCYYSYGDCTVPGTGNGGLVALGVVMFLLSFVIYYGIWFWNRVYKVSKTGQSIGRKMSGLKVINAEAGRNPTLGEAFLRELIASVAGIISSLWMLFDDDRRTLADMVGKTAVIKDQKQA